MLEHEEEYKEYEVYSYNRSSCYIYFSISIKIYQNIYNKY